MWRGRITPQPNHFDHFIVTAPRLWRGLFIGENTMRSPARTELHGHHDRVHQAVEDAVAHRARYAKALDQEQRATALVRQREAELAQIDREEAELIAGSESWSATDEQRQARRMAEDNLAAARRAVLAIHQHGELLRVPLEEAERAAGQIVSETPSLVDDVLAEEGHARLTALAVARADAASIEAAVRSVAEALVARKSYRHAEVINIAVNTMRHPEARPNPRSYLVLAERLASDANATAVMS
jgi:hypothetical protein